MALMGTAKITDAGIKELRSRIGVTLRTERGNTVASLDSIEAFARRMGDENPLWVDQSYARSTRYGCIIAPPTFLYSFLWPTGGLAGGLPGVHSFHGGNDWQFFKVVRVNDRISASAKLIDVTEKQSTYGGRSVILTVEASYKNQYDEPMAVAKGWSIRVEREAGRERGKYAGMTPHPYTPEEYKAIDDNCISVAEQRCGARPKYWEDVKEGDELPPLAKGPLGGHTTARPKLQYHLRVQEYRKHPAFFYRDPETNALEPVTAVTMYDYAAQAVGIPKAYDLGPQRICWLGQMLTDWMGDDGFLERLYVKLLRPNLIGDTQWCKGRVSRKYMRDGQPLVDCEIWCDSQRGEQTATGEATIRLLSKKSPVSEKDLLIPSEKDLSIS